MKRLTVLFMVVVMVIGTATALCAAELPRGVLMTGVAVEAQAIPDSDLATLRGTYDPPVIPAMGAPGLAVAFQAIPGDGSGLPSKPLGQWIANNVVVINYTLGAIGWVAHHP